MYGEKIHGPLQGIPLQSKVLSENDERNKKHGKPRSSYSSDKHNVAQNGQVRAERYHGSSMAALKNVLDEHVGAN